MSAGASISRIEILQTKYLISDVEHDTIGAV
jgi:hypothetical protein